MPRKWIEVNDLFGGQYSVTKNVRFKTLMLLCDYSDTYIVGKGRISMNDKKKKKKKSKSLRIMLHLDHAYQKSITN